jgi:type VI secretion system protein VasG
MPPTCSSRRLARGTLRTVGATTWSEYKRHIEKDPALTRRFQTLQVAEPEEAAAIEMVRGLVATFAEHHGVTVLDEAVRAAVTLSHRYIPARQLPDKAISLLDTACARVAMSLHTPPAVVEQLRSASRRCDVELDLLAQERVVAQGSEIRSKRCRSRKAKLGRDNAVDELALQEANGTTNWRWSSRFMHCEGVREEAKKRRAAPGPIAPAQLIALEQALSRASRRRHWSFPKSTKSVVAAIVADWTGIPVGRMVKTKWRPSSAFRPRSNERVIGQGHALAAIAERVQIARARLADPTSRWACSCWSAPRASARPKPRWHWPRPCTAESRTSSPST